jgi:sugar phosphate isomerase/epimerase
MTKPFTLSLPHLTMLDATPPQVVAAAAAAGFDHVSMRLIPTMAGEQPHPMQPDSPMLRETMALIADTGVTPYDIEALWLKPDSSPENYLRAFESAQAVGARCIQVIAADPDEQRLADTLRRFCDQAAGFGLGLALEFMAISELRSLAAALRVFQACGADNLALTMDVLHFYRCGTSLHELEEVRPEWIGLVQVCDAPLAAPQGHAAMLHEARFERRLPGEGQLPVREWLAAMPRGGVLAIEAPQPQRDGARTPQERAHVLMNSLQAYLAGASSGAS